MMLDVVALADKILADAISQKALQIAVAPQREYLRIRVWGVGDAIIETIHLSKEAAKPLVARFKALALLDLSVERAIQSGALQFIFGAEEYHLTVKTLPTMYGEKVAVWISQPSELPDP